MALSSMTGFARSQGETGVYAFEWELKSVNAKGLDLRLRLPAGWDAVEPFARKRGAEALSRGTVYANLTVKRANAAPEVRVNEDLLNSVMKVAGDLSSRLGAAPPTVDGLLAIRGVLDVVEPSGERGRPAGRGSCHHGRIRTCAEKPRRDAPTRKERSSQADLAAAAR